MKKENTLFGTLQKIGHSFMLPIAALPVAGLFLGIGCTFSGEGFFFKVLTMLSNAGNQLFGILSILFAVAVAGGLAKKDKEVAALSAVIAYFVMNQSIASTVDLFMDIDKLSQTSGLMTTVFGIAHTMNTGVLGGVVIGWVVSVLHNRYQNIKLPDALSFFGGNHFIPIVSTVAAIVVGILFAIVWPYVGLFLVWLGSAISKLGIVGTFFYGLILRALIPTGLHHVFYMPFWQTALGGTATVAGQYVEGAQNILMAQLASGETISTVATRFYSGNYPIMMFGFPAAALAMYVTAKKENKDKAKGLLLSSALTSFLTGITEPLEFSFLFASPLLYFGVHCVLGGLSFALCHLLSAGVGYTFSAGLLDFIIYGVIPGNGRTHWISVLLIGIVYFFVYYFAFKIIIEKLDLKTPGREDEVEDVRLHTKKEYLASKEADAVSEMIVDGLGGVENLVDIDNCATRLRVQLVDGKKVDDAILKQSGAAGIFKKGNSIQVIYGPKVVNIKNDLDNYVKGLKG